jgi:hypothetical protein
LKLAREILILVREWSEKAKESGVQTRLCEDIWLEECPTKKIHPKAIKILNELNLSVVEAGICIVGNLHSKEVFEIYELIEWNELT